MTRRLVYVTASLPFGSGEAFAIPELLELQRLGFELLIVPVLPRGPIVHEDARPLAAWTVALPLLSPGILFSALAALVMHPRRVLAAVRGLVGGQRPRIAAKNLVILPKGLWLARLAMTKQVSHLHAYWASAPASLAFIAATVAGLPFSQTAHSWDVGERNAIEAKVSRASATRIISEDRGAELLRVLRSGSRERIHLVHLGVAIPADVPTPPPRDRPIVVVPAMFVPTKAHAVLLDALQRLSEKGVHPQVSLIGDGPGRRHVIEEVRRRGLTESTTIESPISHSDLLRRYATGGVDLVVLPSATLPDGTREGIPVSLMEAMAYGIPVVGTSCGGIPELIGGGAGVLIPENDAEALALAIESMAKDPLARREQGMAGRRRVQQGFDVREQTRRLIEVAGF